MFLSDLIVLGIAFSAGWIYLKTSEELHCLLCAITGSICLIVGLVLAPWPVQLGLVMLLLCFDTLKTTKGYQ